MKSKIQSQVNNLIVVLSSNYMYFNYVSQITIKYTKISMQYNNIQIQHTKYNTLD
jgi:hypothetical protein